jgi:large subunit ribosomal protein L17
MRNRKLGRDSAHRKALLRNLSTSLIVHERIETTEKKAYELRSYADKLVTLAKRGDLHARRQAAKVVFNVVADEATAQTALQKLFDEIGPRYADRKGGYTRVVKTEKRRGDGSSMAYVEFV